MTRHKDGSPGVYGCESMESRSECPECLRYDASQAIEQACAYVKALDKFHSSAYAIRAELGRQDNLLNALEFVTRKREALNA